MPVKLGRKDVTRVDVHPPDTYTLNRQSLLQNISFDDGPTTIHLQIKFSINAAPGRRPIQVRRDCAARPAITYKKRPNTLRRSTRRRAPIVATSLAACSLPARFLPLPARLGAEIYAAFADAASGATCCECASCGGGCLGAKCSCLECGGK